MMNNGQLASPVRVRPAMAGLFRNTKVPFGQLPILRTTLLDIAARCAVAICELTNLKTSFALDRIDEVPVGALMVDRPGMVWSRFMVPQWEEQICIGFDASLLFRAIDAMFGGEDSAAVSVPDRGLSRLEREVCSRIASVVMNHVRSGLAKLAAFDIGPPRVDQFIDASAFEKGSGHLVVVQMHLVELNERLLIALPAKGLETARELLEKVETKAPGPALDPNWTRMYQESAAASRIDLVACASGPSVMLSDVARWMPGSVVEFDAECLQKVVLQTVDGEPIFAGRLGQSKGMFTICVEAPFVPRSRDVNQT